jgi:hypothetical protein
MGILIALAFPQEYTPAIVPGVFMFCVPSLLVTFQLTCVLFGICFDEAVKATLRVALK